MISPIISHHSTSFPLMSTSRDSLDFPEFPGLDINSMRMALTRGCNGMKHAYSSTCLPLCLGPREYVNYLVFEPDFRLRPAGEGGACGAPVEEGRGAREDPRCALFLSRAPSGRPPADPGWGASRPRRRRDAVERTPLQLRGPRSFSGGRVSVTFISGPTAGF